MNKKLNYIAIFNYILIIPIALYFKYFPTIINGTITNIIIIGLISSFIISLIYGIRLIGKNNKDYYYIIPQSLIFVFVITAIPSLRLENPLLQDPYYYLVTAMNIINYGTLNTIDNWYSLTDQQLHWPVLQLLTSNLVFLSKLNPFNYMKFLMPSISTIIFLSIFLLIKTVSNDNRISILAALVSSLGSISIFYNSEFHPQSIAPLFFILFLYFYYKLKHFNNIIFGALMILSILVFSMSHHFSSLFIGTFALIYIITVFFITKIKSSDLEFLDLVSEAKNYNFWILIAVAMLSYHIYVYFGFIKGIFDQATNSNPQLSLVTVGVSVPLFTTIVNSTKWIVFVLAIPAIYYSYKNKNKNEFQFALLFLCFILAGLMGSTILAIPTDRIIIFFYPFAAFFASITLFKLFEKYKGNLVQFSLIGLISFVIISGIFGSQTPAYFFKNSEVDTFYFASNDLSSANYLDTAGKWIKDYTNPSKFFAVQFDTKSLTFFFGKIKLNKFSSLKYNMDGYVVVNPSIPYDSDFNKTNYLNSINTFYSDGEIIVGGNKV